MKLEEESGGTDPFPQTLLNQRGPAWNASNTPKYTGSDRGSQCPTRPMSRPLTYHGVGSCGSRRKERAYEAVLLRRARLCLWPGHADLADEHRADASEPGRETSRQPQSDQQMGGR